MIYYRDEVSGLFVITSRNTTASTIAGSIVGMVESGASLRRVTNVRRTTTFTSAAASVKRRSVGIQIKYQMVVIFVLSLNFEDRVCCCC